MAKNTFVAEVTFKISHHPTKFGGHRHCGSGVIIILVSHVILQDCVIKGSCGITARSP